MSKVSINSLFSKIVEESAEAKDSSKEDSNLSRVTENSFYFLTSSCFYISSSFFSIFTTVASNCSSTLLGYDKIDDGTLGSDFGSEVGVCQFCD